MKINNSEKELNDIRIALYEETKDLSIKDRTRLAREARQIAIKKYNLKIHKAV